MLFLLHGNLPGGAAGGSLEQVDALWQVDDRVVVQGIGVPHFLSGQVKDAGAAHILAALDEDAAFPGQHLQGLVGVNAGDAAGIDGDDVGRFAQIAQAIGLYIVGVQFARLAVGEGVARRAVVIGSERLGDGFAVGFVIYGSGNDIVIHLFARCIPVGDIAVTGDAGSGKGSEL